MFRLAIIPVIMFVMIDSEMHLWSILQVRLAVPGWKKRYYEVKFSARTPEEMESMRKKLVFMTAVYLILFPWNFYWLELN